MGRLKSGGTGCLLFMLLATWAFLGGAFCVERLPEAGQSLAPMLDPTRPHPQRAWPENVVGVVPLGWPSAQVVAESIAPSPSARPRLQIREKRR